MKERPIIFSAPMVRALLDGRKQQTRRILKPQPQMVQGKRIAPWEGDGVTLMRLLEQTGKRCPYGQPGDRLWVRETWQAIDGNELALRIMTEPHPSRGWIEYAATVPEGHEPPPRWRPSIHMPRWASRITLEVTGVRVERLQDISTADALAEGVNVHPDHHDKPPGSIYSPVQAYRDLWEGINGAGSWDANPWVFVIEFKRIKP